MKNNVAFIFFLAILSFVAPTFGQTSFEVTSTNSNTSRHITTIDNPATNNKPQLALFVSQNYGKYNANEIGVWYNNGKWTIYNQNRSTMPIGTKFKILVTDPSVLGRAKIHKTTTRNTKDHITTIDHGLTNNNPNACIIVTQNYGKYNTSPVGVWYNNGKWKIYNESKESMPIGTMFNILVLKNNVSNTIGSLKGSAFQHQTTSRTKRNFSSKHVSYISHASTNKNLSKAVFYTPNWKSTYNQYPTGIWFHENQWSIFNQNRKEVPNGVNFNVFAITTRNSASPTSSLSAPTLISPQDNTSFDHFPRNTVVHWQPVSRAASYVVEVDCLHCCESGKWCTEVGEYYKVKKDIRTTTYQFKWVGAQKGRWRVYAVDSAGRKGRKSGWRNFKYTR